MVQYAFYLEVVHLEVVQEDRMDCSLSLYLLTLLLLEDIVKAGNCQRQCQLAYFTATCSIAFLASHSQNIFPVAASLILLSIWYPHADTAVSL